MGIIERGLNIIIIITSIAMILHGLIKADAYTWIVNLIKKDKNEP